MDDSAPAVNMTARRSGKRARNAPKLQRADDESSSRQEYLAAELGHAVDRDGEPIGLNGSMARGDAELQNYAVQLWSQVSAGRALRGQLRELERDGMTMEDIWATGITELLPTSCTLDEVQRYKRKLLFRANVLEAILTETVTELKRVDRLQPADSEKQAD